MRAALSKPSLPQGFSGKLSKQGVCFCISTAYEGTYLDSYYLDLLTEPQVRIHRHSIPIFIPLEQIAKKYLQTDIRRFLSVLSDHLNAYVGRRYQADQLQVPVAVMMLFTILFPLMYQMLRVSEVLGGIWAVFSLWRTHGSAF